MNPIRIQRRRTKGWSMPPNTACVTRPSKWGNGFIVRPYPVGQWEVFDTEDLTDELDPEPLLLAAFPSKVLASENALGLFCEALKHGTLRFCVDDIRQELRGKNLACYCPIGSPCHADVLLKIANSEEL